jgi:hypothetical protein
MLGFKIANVRRCNRITGLELPEDHVLLWMVARIRIVFEVVNDPENHLIVWAIAAIKHAEFLFEYSKQFFDVPMFLTQNFDDVCHRGLPGMPSVRIVLERSGPPADSFE